MAIIEADFEEGVLRPTRPLALRPGERVRLVVVRSPDPSRWNLEKLAQHESEDESLASAGLEDWAKSLDQQHEK